ncbi:hypothetical protein FACS189440_20110 [Bacteroidia bacterium]|nr:hypothetical protein FACS189440_20110 [Bacteroidia bacterium]
MNHKLRKDKRCQNCGHYVDKRFCPNCGQENVETRQPFHYLFTHFVADFIHYDGQFWKTIQYLLFYPARLTQEYIAGKRKSYVQPVQLYIFISFLVFFIPAILPGFDEKPDVSIEKESKEIHKSIAEELNIPENQAGIYMYGLKNVHSVQQLDSIQQALPKEEKLLKFQYVIYKKVLKYKNLDEIKDKIGESLIHNMPKAIFLYMPIFAFWLWVFHNKKKWLYFDHGIYTLHYFSFLLLTILLYIVVNWLLSLFHWEIPGLITFAMFCWFIFYFFRSHSQFYRQKKAISRWTCINLFIINTIGIIIFLVLYVLFISFISV